MKSCISFATIMFQLNFSEQSMGELNKLDTRAQMELIEAVSNLRQEDLDRPDDSLGRFQRNGRTYFRVRTGDFRIYFEQREGALYAHYILHKNTLTDFVFRFKMPVTEEFIVEQKDSFWEYLESLRKQPDSE